MQLSGLKHPARNTLERLFDFSIAQFLRQFPERQEDLVHLLIGNVYRHPVDGLLSAMDEYRELPKYEPIAIDTSTG